MARRLLYLDILRGFFITYVVATHAVSHLLLYGDAPFPLDINTIEIWQIIVFFPIILISTWAPIFALVSGSANAYVNYNLIKKKLNQLKESENKVRKTALNKILNKMVKDSLLNALVMFAASFIHVSLFHYGLEWNGEIQRSFLTGSLELGGLSAPTIPMLFYTDAIALMAMSSILTSIILRLLWGNNRFMKVKENFIILTVLGIIWMVISPIFHTLLLDEFFLAIDNGNYLLAVVLKLIVGPPHSTFPNVSFAIFGAVFGIAMAQNVDKKQIIKYGYIMGSCWIVGAFLIILLVGFRVSPESVGTSLPVEVHMLNLGLIILLNTFLIKKIEFQEKETRQKIAKRTIWIRRFSMMAMSCYMFESFLCVLNLKWYLPLWLEFPASDLVIALCVILFTILQTSIWYGIIRLWERFNFKYSPEWCVVAVAGRLRGRRSVKLNVEKTLYEPAGIHQQQP